MIGQQTFDKALQHFLEPIVPLLDDESVSEIVVNGPRQIFYERAGVLRKYDGTFASDQSLLAAARNIAQYVGRTIDDGVHSVDARLPNGSRVHIMLAPTSRQGTCLSIRKFQRKAFSLDALVERAFLTEAAAICLKEAVVAHRNIVISGGTGTGKTSLLNALSGAIPPEERIIVIEDTSELQLHQPHTVYLEAQAASRGHPVTIRDLFVDSLRMRPDRIVVGEVRRGEALDLIQSMLSGHAGALSTVHANTPRDAAIRLETLCLMSDVSLPLYVARVQVASAVHLVVQIVRFRTGVRRIVSISEMLPLAADQQYAFRELFRYRPGTGHALDGEGQLEAVDATGGD